jgi:hypothetical protein
MEVTAWKVLSCATLLLEGLVQVYFISSHLVPIFVFYFLIFIHLYSILYMCYAKTVYQVVGYFSDCCMALLLYGFVTLHIA